MQLNKLGLFGKEIKFWNVEDAREIGTLIHDMIKRINDGERISEDEWFGTREPIRQGVRAYLRWKYSVGYNPRENEIIVYSLKNGYAGTIDSIGTIKQHVVIIDYKTGVLDKDYVSMQLTLYFMAYREMFPRRKVNRLICLQLDKTTGRYSDYLEVLPDEALNKYYPIYIQCKREAGIL